MRKTVIFCLFTLLFVSMLQAGSVDDIFAQLEAAKKENIYPEPQEKTLATIRDKCDRVIWIFRAYSEALLKETNEGKSAYSLAEALEQHHLELCWLYTFDLQKEKERKKLQLCIENLDIPEDAAAFLPLLKAGELTELLSPYKALLEEAEADLQKDGRLELYVKAIAGDREFFRKKRPWHKLGDLVKKGVDGLLAKLETKFSKENLIRFFARVERWQRGKKLGQKAGEIRGKLFNSLKADIQEDFQNRISAGLCEKTRMISKTENGFIMTSTSLLNGRFRRFVKRLKTCEDGRDLRLFLPVLSFVDRNVVLPGKLHAAEKKTITYLEQVHSTIETMTVIYKLKARRDAEKETEVSLWKSISRFAGEMDDEGLLSGLEELQIAGE